MVERITIALLGTGNFPVLAPTLATLAMYHGERPLELILWDPSQDFVTVGLSLAKRLCIAAGNFHQLEATTEWAAAIERAQRILWMLDSDGQNRNSIVPRIPETPILALGNSIPVPSEERTPWPSFPDPDRLKYYPHQVLRWIKEDDEPRYLLWEHERSPITDWLNA